VVSGAALFVVVGDLTLDITVAPSRPPRPGGDVRATIRLGAGGQAANVAVRLARRGCAVRLVAAIGGDAAGGLLERTLEDEGIDLAPIRAPRSATVVALLDPTGERTMLSDRQVLDPTAVGAALDGAGWIHCSGYALLDDETGDALAGLLAARAGGARLSVGGGSVPPEPAVVDRFRGRLAAAGPDLVLHSLSEANALLGGAVPTPREAARRLAGLATVVVITAGAEGSAAAVTAGDGTLDLVDATAPAAGGPVLDATGAGDAYAAAVLAGLAGAAWPPAADGLAVAMEAGSALGGLVARVVGAQGRVSGEPP
jgi:sugar/nucleoside kinase (ribokinase family)